MTDDTRRAQAQLYARLNIALADTGHFTRQDLLVLLRDCKAALSSADTEVQELLTLLDLVEVEHTQDTPQVKFYDDPVQFAREMAARFAVDRDRKKHELRAVQEKLDAEVGRLTQELADAKAEIRHFSR